MIEKLLGDKVETAGEYVAEIIYGANDGIITTFAVVSGVAGASLQPSIVVILGFANLFADGFSMGMSNYLSGVLRETTRRRRMSIPRIREGRLKLPWPPF